MTVYLSDDDEQCPNCGGWLDHNGAIQCNNCGLQFRHEAMKGKKRNPYNGNIEHRQKKLATSTYRC